MNELKLTMKQGCVENEIQTLSTYSISNHSNWMCAGLKDHRGSSSEFSGAHNITNICTSKARNTQANGNYYTNSFCKPFA